MDRSKSRAFLGDVLFIVALSTVFFSTVLPLVTFEPLPAKFIYLDIPLLLPKQDFSTFMTRENSALYPQTTYFEDYWRQSNWLTTYSTLPVSGLLVAVFTLQVLTLAVGFGVFWVRRLLRILPLALCVPIAILLTWILFSLWTDGGFVWNVGAGYWFSYLSPLLISVSVIVGRRK